MNRKKGLYEKYIKRILDVVLSGFALIILSPVLIGVAVLVKIKLGSPVLFKQKRPGLNEELFEMYKFRSMTDERDENGELLPDEKRLTTFGKKLRSTSLDELPELLNILKGDMSIVGPRPLLVSYLDRYDDIQRTRQLVKPGITGLAQVTGRNTLSWEEKFKYDIEYLNNVSFLFDAKIIFKTAGVVLKREGISSASSSTMEEFKGAEYEKHE